MNESTTAGEVDKIEQIEGNVLSNATKHKETIVHNRFGQKLSPSGAFNVVFRPDKTVLVDWALNTPSKLLTCSVSFCFIIASACTLRCYLPLLGSV